MKKGKPTKISATAPPVRLRRQKPPDYNLNRSFKKFEEQLIKSKDSTAQALNDLDTKCMKFSKLNTIRQLYCMLLNIAVSTVATDIQRHGQATNRVQVLTKIDPCNINTHLDISNLWKAIQAELANHSFFKAIPNNVLLHLVEIDNKFRHKPYDKIGNNDDYDQIIANFRLLYEPTRQTFMTYLKPIIQNLTNGPRTHELLLTVNSALMKLRGKLKI